MVEYKRKILKKLTFHFSLFLLLSYSITFHFKISYKLVYYIYILNIACSPICQVWSVMYKSSSNMVMYTEINIPRGLGINIMKSNIKSKKKDVIIWFFLFCPFFFLSSLWVNFVEITRYSQLHHTYMQCVYQPLILTVIFFTM